MKRLLGVAALALSLSPMEAQTTSDAVGNVLPPIEYDQPYTGQLVILRGDKARMAGLCPKTPFPITLGCVVKVQEGRGCIIVVANDDILKNTPWNYEMVLRHENGHCQNWPGDHRGSRPPTPENMANYPAKAEPIPTVAGAEMTAWGPKVLPVMQSLPVPLRGHWPSDMRRSQ
jgi:hypothetical protein